MPYFIDTNLRAYLHEGSVKFDLQLSRDIQLTNNFFITPGIRSIAASKTVKDDEIGSGLNEMEYSVTPFYHIAPGISLFAEYTHERDHGRLKRIHRKEGESTRDDTLSFGISVVL